MKIVRITEAEFDPARDRFVELILTDQLQASADSVPP